MGHDDHHQPARGGRPARSGIRRRSALVALILASAGLGPALMATPPAVAAVPSLPAGSSGNPVPIAADPALPNLPAISDGYGGSPTQNAAFQTAAKEARVTAKPVAVDALTTETEQLVALPTGGAELSANTQPVRTKQHGRWVRVDTALHQTSSGDYSPAATAYADVVLSGGGAGPLVSTKSGATDFALAWPGTLPKPVIKGSTATYPDVLPGVDLAASATVSGGFSEVLIVKTAAAAKNPKLRKLKLAVSTSAGHSLHAGQHGQLVNVTDQRTGRVLQATVPRMWDSNTDALATDDELNAPSPASPAAKSAIRTATANPATAKVFPDKSDDAHPGLVAREKFIPTAVSNQALTLTPDAALLNSPATVFPVYIDPTFNWHDVPNLATPAFDEVKQGSPCNGVSLYGNTGSAGDYGQLGVGVNAWDGCTGTMRAYYQWKLPSSLWDAQINTATVNAREVYSASCSTTSTVNLHHSSAISSGTNWNSRPHTGTFTTSASFAPASNPNNCSTKSDVSHGLNVKSVIVSSASAHDSEFAVYLSEDSAESSRASVGFKRFSDNPALQIQFNRTPDTPTTTVMAATSGAEKAACDTTAPYPYIGKTLASAPPLLTTTVSDPDSDKLQAKFTYWLDGSSTTATGLSNDNLSSNTPAKFSLPSSFVSSLTNGQVVDWKATVTDGEATSTSSPTCHFTAEPTAPSQPTIVSADGNYPTGDPVPYGKPEGTPGSFTLTNTGTTATKFAYALDIAPSLTAPVLTVPVTNNTATITLTPQAAGPHTLWVDAMDSANDVSAMASYQFIVSSDPNVACGTWSQCLNNYAISPDATPTDAAADGLSSYSATDLTNAGWKSGGKVTVNGATFTLPTFGRTSLGGDNVVADNQTITFNQSVPATGTTAMSFLAFSTQSNSSTPGPVDGNTTAPYLADGTHLVSSYCFDSTNPAAYCAPAGVITYTDHTTTPYKLLVPDWTEGPASLASVTLPHENRPTGQISTHQPKIYAVSIPVTAGKTIASITLPDTAAKSVDVSTPALHILGISTRNTTTTTAPVPTGESWTGSWSSPNEGQFNWSTAASFSNLTFRTSLKPSVGGNAIRVKLDNALGTNPLSIGHATVALTPNTYVATPSGAVTNLTFGGSASVTIPDGGMVYSDPIPYTVTANNNLLVSFSLTNSVPALVQHSLASTAHVFISANGSGDHTADTTASAFSGTGSATGLYTDVLTDVDVATSGVATQAVLGDSLIDAWQPNATASQTDNRLAEDLSNALSSTSASTGILAEGIESNQLLKDNPETYKGGGVGGPSALSRIDRDLLDQPGIKTVVFHEGLDDVLNGTPSDVLSSKGFNTLMIYLAANHITPVVVGLPPCDGYTGDGATGNSTNDPCSAAIDAARQTTNESISQDPTVSYIDADAAIGVPDTTNGLIKLDVNAALTDKVNLTQSGFSSLATAYLGPQDTWLLDDGSMGVDGDTSGITSASDSASSGRSPYLAGNASVGTQPAALSATGATWTTDTTRGNVLALNGTTGTAMTSTPALDTSASYSVSAWAYLSNTSATSSVISESGVNTPAFSLQYDKTANTWAFITTTADSATPTQIKAVATTAPTLNSWTGLIGTYNAITHTATLFVNGVQVGTATNSTPWKASRSTNLGSTGTANYFPGKLSNVQAWTYALTQTQVTALQRQVH